MISCEISGFLHEIPIIIAIFALESTMKGWSEEEIGDGSLFESVARNPLIHFEASYR